MFWKAIFWNQGGKYTEIGAITFLSGYGSWLRPMVMVDVTTLKMTRKAVKLQKENPAGCDGEGKQSKGN